MPTPVLMHLPKTSSPEEFELLCRDVLNLMRNQNFQLYGRKGQYQNGIDLYADLPDGGRIVAQCKNYLTSDTGSRLVEFLKKDLASASADKSIQEFIIMTALDRDTKVQNELSKLVSDHSFTITTYFWDDIAAIIVSNTDLLIKYYPSLYGIYFPISMPNRLISNLMLMKDMVNGFKNEYSNYVPMHRQAEDIAYYNCCMCLYSSASDIYNTVQTNYVELNRRGIADKLEELYRLLPKFYPEIDGTGSNMIYTITDYVKFFTDKQCNAYSKKCEKLIKELEN